MNRDDWMVWLRGALIAPLLVLLLALPALADGYPCPSKGAACWQVRIAKATFGASALIAKARSCGWTESDIARIRTQCNV